jgi:hypothetical protein
MNRILTVFALGVATAALALSCARAELVSFSATELNETDLSNLSEQVRRAILIHRALHPAAPPQARPLTARTEGFLVMLEKIPLVCNGPGEGGWSRYDALVDYCKDTDGKNPCDEFSAEIVGRILGPLGADIDMNIVNQRMIQATATRDALLPWGSFSLADMKQYILPKLGSLSSRIAMEKWLDTQRDKPAQTVPPGDDAAVEAAN